MSFNGNIEEIPHISVDNFTNTRKKVFFLSHCHTDHTTGFKDLRKGDVCIYTSDINVKIMEHEMDDTANYMIPLEIGSPKTIKLPSNSEENLEEMYVTVTLIPAGHCLGSTMILFGTNNKTVLYTGDFRISPSDISKFRDFHCPPYYKTPIHIDAMYVDTTFSDVYYEDFPKRSDSIEYLIGEIKNWLREDNNKVAIRTSAKYGYEYVFNEIYKNLGKKVYVNENKWRLYSEFKTAVTGVTNDDSDIDIHNCTGQAWRNSHDTCIPTNKSNFSFLYINLSAMKWKGYNPDEKPLDKEGNTVHVCFATHCSKSELKYFINYFNPDKIIGFPTAYVPTPPKHGPAEIVFTPPKKVRSDRKRKVPFNL